MRQAPLVVLLVVVVLAGVSFGLATRRAASSVAVAFTRAQSALNALYAPYVYHDEYLAYRYPNEHIECPIEGCRVTYRLLDAYFNVRMLADDSVHPLRLGRQTEDAEAVLPALLPWWREQPFLGTAKRNAQNGVGLDTTCLLGLATNDRPLAERALSALDESGSWLPPDYFSDDAWRNIADETWCIRLMNRFPETKAAALMLAADKQREGEQFLSRSADPVERVAVLYHLVPLALETGGGATQSGLEWMVTELEQLASSSALAQNTVALANILETLSIVKKGNKKTAAHLANLLLAQQQPGGMWLQPGTPDGYPAFTTLRVLRALQEYSAWEE